MRYIGSFILLLCFLCLRANAQGLEFNTYESETIQKTSYSVFDENPLTFKGHFSISYDLAIQDYVNPEKRLGRLYKNQAFQKVQKRNVHEKRWI